MLLTFWATFFVFYDPLDFSTGICPTPTRQKVGKTQLCALFTIIFEPENVNFKTRDISPLIEYVLAGVTPFTFISMTQLSHILPSLPLGQKPTTSPLDKKFLGLAVS